MNITKKIITHEEDKCISDGQIYLSNPPQLKCSKCGQFWFAKDLTPVCKNVEINTVFEEVKRIICKREEWEVQDKWEHLVQNFLIQQLAWEKSVTEEKPEGSPVLKEMAETRLKKINDYLHSLLEERTNEIITLVEGYIEENAYVVQGKNMSVVLAQSLEEFTAKLRERYL